MEPVMSVSLCGFRKGYSTQHALMRLIENAGSFLINMVMQGAAYGSF